MIRLDEPLLNELGLARLTRREKSGLLAHLHETLESRVGMRVSSQMSDKQLSEFEAFIEAEDEDGALSWLEDNFPAYKSVVTEEFEDLKDEVADLAAEILRHADTTEPGETDAALPVQPTSAHHLVWPSQEYSTMARPTALRVAAVQLDYIPRLATRAGHWIPDEPLMLDDPLAVLDVTLSTKELLQGPLGEEVKAVLAAEEAERSAAEEAKLRQILQFARTLGIDLLVLPEGICSPIQLDLLREYSDELAIFAGLGRIRGEDLAYLPPVAHDRLVQRNAAVYIDRGEQVWVSKRTPANGELAERGEGPVVVELRRHGQTYKIGLAICLDFLNSKSSLGADGAGLDAVLISALTRVVDDFVDDPLRNYIRVFANHARFGGSTIVAPSLSGSAFIDGDRVSCLPQMTEGLCAIDYAGFGTRPENTFPALNRLVARSAILAPDDSTDPSLSAIAGDMLRLTTADFRGSPGTRESVRQWSQQLTDKPASGILRESIDALVADATADTLTENALRIFASHLSLDEVQAPAEHRYRQLTSLRTTLRAQFDSAEGANLGSYLDAYRDALNALAPHIRRKYRQEEHQYVPVATLGREQENQGPSDSEVFFAVRLGLFDSEDAVASLPRQLSALTTLCALGDTRLRLRYRLSTTRDDDGELRPLFDVIGSSDGAGPDQITFLREGLGQQFGRAFSGAWHVSGTTASPAIPQRWTRSFVVPADDHYLRIGEDWAPLVDYLRALGQPLSVELEAQWVPAHHEGSSREVADPWVAEKSMEGYANAAEQTAVKFFGRASMLEATGHGGLRLSARVWGTEPIADPILTSIGVDLLGHSNFALRETTGPGEDLGVHPPQEAIRLFHPPYGHMEGRGLSTSRATAILASSTGIARDGVVIGKAQTASGRADQVLKVRLSEAARNRHTYILGRSGSGKTNLLKHMARQDIAAGKGTAVIDPHGDLVDYLLGHLAGREKETVLLDFGHPEFIPVLNPLDLDVDSSEGRNLAIEEFISILVHQSYHEFYGPRFEDIVRLTLESILQPTYPFTPTVLDIARLLRSPKRRTWMRELTKGTAFDERWRVFDSQRDTDIGEVLHWALSKFSEMSEDGVLGQVLAGGRSSVSIDSVVKNGGILLVRLPEWEMTASAASFLGTLVQERIRRAAYGRWRRHRERSDAIETFYLYVDEFQNFATTGFEDLVAEGRKFGLSLTLANQNLSQLSRFSRFTGSTSPNLVDALLGNVATILVLGVSSRDEVILSDELGVSREAIRNIGAWSGLFRSLSPEGGPMSCFSVNFQNADRDTGSPRTRAEIPERMISTAIWRSREAISADLAAKEQEMARRVEKDSTRSGDLLDGWLKKSRSSPPTKPRDADDVEAAQAGETDGEADDSADLPA